MSISLMSYIFELDLIKKILLKKYYTTIKDFCYFLADKSLKRVAFKLRSSQPKKTQLHNYVDGAFTTNSQVSTYNK